jgi:hypothetical protein
MTDEKSAPKKPEGQHARPVYPNPGQPLTGNKNQGEDIELLLPCDAIIDRPTRDDGDNDDLGDLGGPLRVPR